jgi:hypothetical protein
MVEQFKIWEPYKYLYLESLFTITRSSFHHIEIFSETNNYLVAENFSNDIEEVHKKHDSEILLLDSLHNIINHASALSRYFWPSGKKELYINRGEFLREKFEIDNGNPLKARQVRNAIEHFDERLDEFAQKPVVGVILPYYVGRKPNTAVQSFVFRAYYTDEQTFEVLGEKFKVIPIIDEIVRINELIFKYMKSGQFR